jgi:hypothetical protein
MWVQLVAMGSKSLMTINMKNYFFLIHLFRDIFFKRILKTRLELRRRSNCCKWDHSRQERSGTCRRKPLFQHRENPALHFATRWSRLDDRPTTRSVQVSRRRSLRPRNILISFPYTVMSFGSCKTHLIYLWACCSTLWSFRLSSRKRPKSFPSVSKAAPPLSA